MVVVSRIWRGITAGHLYPDNHFENPAYILVAYYVFFISVKKIVQFSANLAARFVIIFAEGIRSVIINYFF